MNLRPAFSRHTAKLAAALSLVAVFSLAAGWTAANAAASSSHSSLPSASLALTGANTELGAPGSVPANSQSGVGYAGSGTTSGSSSIAYPIPGYAGPLGVAPEGTILAAGTGTADMKADGSDRAAALSKATVAALKDARASAQATASAMGVALKDIYSISTSSSESFNYPAIDCTLPMLPTQGGATTGGSGPNVPVIVPAPSAGTSGVPCAYAKVSSPTSSQLVVTVVVAYRFV